MTAELIARIRAALDPRDGVGTLDLQRTPQRIEDLLRDAADALEAGMADRMAHALRVIYTQRERGPDGPFRAPEWARIRAARGLGLHCCCGDAVEDHDDWGDCRSCPKCFHYDPIAIPFEEPA